MKKITKLYLDLHLNKVGHFIPKAMHILYFGGCVAHYGVFDLYGGAAAGLLIVGILALFGMEGGE